MYIGTKTDDGAFVVVVAEIKSPGGSSCKTRALDPRLDLMNHSPSGFAWGYMGSGPAQLALAMLADAVGDDDAALRLYQRFKERVVARFKIGKGWNIQRAVVLRVADMIATGYMR